MCKTWSSQVREPRDGLTKIVKESVNQPGLLVPSNKFKDRGGKRGIAT